MFALRVIRNRFLESVKGLGCNSLSCSSSISEVTVGPERQHKDARWIFPSHVLCTGKQKADDRRPNHAASFSLSLFPSLTLTYSDMSLCFVFLPELAPLISSFCRVTCLSNVWKKTAELLEQFWFLLGFLLTTFVVVQSRLSEFLR